VSFISIGNSTIQISSAPNLRGRALSLWQFAFQGTTPGSGPLIGWVIEASEARVGMAVGALSCFVATAGGAFISRHRLAPAPASGSGTSATTAQPRPACLARRARSAHVLVVSAVSFVSATAEGRPGGSGRVVGNATLASLRRLWQIVWRTRVPRPPVRLVGHDRRGRRAERTPRAPRLRGRMSREPEPHGGAGVPAWGPAELEGLPLPPPRRLFSVRSARRAALLVVLALVIEYLLLPQIAGVRASLHLLGRVNFGLVVLGAVLEAASLASYAQLTRSVLPRGVSTFSRVWRIDMSSLAVSHVLPGGTAGGQGIGFRLLTQEGVSGGDTVFVLGSQGIGSAVVLNVILWCALVVSIPLYGLNPLYATAAAIGVVLMAVFGGLVVLFTKGRDMTVKVVRRIAVHVPRLTPDRAERVIEDVSARLLAMARDRRLLVRAVLWAAANWLLDAASLFVFLAAFGHVESVDGLLVAYGLAFVLAALPLTPGGLGIVEAVLVPTLVGFGATRGVVALGVLAYRLFNFWLPIPAGAASYASLEGRHWRRKSPKGPEGNTAAA
jgi:uncharacterized protein (TIRG00374 family)